MIRRLMMPLVLACLWSSTVLMTAPIHDAAWDGDAHRSGNFSHLART